MTQGVPETVIAIYRVQEARMDDFLGLLARHHPTLVRLGLATEDPPVVYRGKEQAHQGGQPIVFEIFAWASAEAAGIAHETPDVAKIWETMATMTEDRDGRPGCEFPHVQRVEVAFGEA